MQVKHRLTINAVISVASALVILIVFSQALYRLNKANNLSKISGDIVLSSFERVTLRNDYLQNSNERAKTQWFATHEAIGITLNSASKHFQDPEDKKTIDELFKNHESIKKIFSAIVKNREKNKSTSGEAVISQEVEDRLVSQLNIKVYEAVLRGRELLVSSRKARSSALRLAGGWTASVLIILIGAMLINSWTMSRAITERVKKLREGALVIGGGDLDHRIDIKGDDEFADLSKAFDAMTAKLQASDLEIKKEIGERKRVEEVLRASEEQFRTLADTIPNLAWWANADGYITWYNRRWYEYTGTTPAQMAGWGWQSVHDPEVLPKVLERWKTSLATGESFEMEFPLLGADREFRPFLTRAMPLKDSAGLVLRWFGTNTDISPQKKSAEEIKRHIAILNGINTIFKEALTSDTDEELARACLRVSEEITGSKFGFIGEVGPEGLLHDTAISDPGWVLCTMYDKTGHRRTPGDFKLHGIYGRVLLDGKSFFTNDPASHPDSIGIPKGHPPLKAFLGVPLISGGKTIGMIAVGNREGGYRQEELEALEALAPAIVEALHRVRAEEALRQSAERLKRSQEIAHLGSWELDLINNSLTWSDEVYRIFGLQPQEFGATYEAFLEAVHPEDRTAVNEAYSSSLREGRDTYEIEHRVMRKATGEIRYVHEKCEHFRDETGKIIRSIGMVHDITERKKAEDDVLKLSEDMAARNRELEAVNRELETFSYSVSHDLRAPLRSIDGFSRALLEDYNDRLDAEGRDFLERILSGIQKMGQLIDDLLNLARVSRTEMRREQVDLSDMAVRIAEGLKQAHPERGVEFIIAEGLSAYGDERLLNIVVENLIGNAWKFTENRSEAVIEFGAINCGLRNADCGVDKNSEIQNPKSAIEQSAIEQSAIEQSEMVYFVKDNGAGFDMTYADKLFAPFQRLHKPAEFAGTGIGLATVKRIVNRHGGHVWIEGDKDKGATVYFTLP